MFTLGLVISLVGVVSGCSAPPKTESLKVGDCFSTGLEKYSKLLSITDEGDEYRLYTYNWVGVYGEYSEKLKGRIRVEKIIDCNSYDAELRGAILNKLDRDIEEITNRVRKLEENVKKR